MTQHPDLLDSENSILLIVDIQTKLMNVMPEEAAKEMLETTSRLIDAANLLNIPVFLSEQYPKGLGPTVDYLTTKLNYSALKFEKNTFSCCSSVSFNNKLQETACKQVVIVGQETHICILQTALDLLQQGYHVLVIEDAVCSRKAEHKFCALQRMQQLGTTINNFESVLFEWLKHSKHPHFKSISHLLH